MKKFLCILLTILLLIPLIGCQRHNDSNAFTFYYPRSDFGYDTLEEKFYDEIIAKEIREDISPSTTYEIISIHLKGPIIQDFANPYPENLSLETVVAEGETLYITVSDHLSYLTGIDLIVACACLGKTGMELTSTTTVQISCRKALLDGKKSIILQNDLIIVNDAVSNAATEQE